MKKEIISSNKVPDAIGPYSQAVKANGFVFVSGQLPINKESGFFGGNTIGEQTRQSLKNISYILENAGLTMESIVKTTVFLQNMGDFSGMNEVYGEFFKGDYPARAAVEVAKLPKGALVEIEAIAVDTGKPEIKNL